MIGTKHGNYVVMKQSGDMFELSNGKEVIRLSESDIKKKAWSKGELMFKIPQPEKIFVAGIDKPKVKPKKKSNARKTKKVV